MKKRNDNIRKARIAMFFNGLMMACFVLFWLIVIIGGIAKLAFPSYVSVSYLGVGLLGCLVIGVASLLTILVMLSIAKNRK